MSIVDSFDHGEEILKPSHIAPPVEGFPKTVLVTFHQPNTDFVRDQYHGTVIGVLDAAVRLPIYQFSYKGHTLALCMTVVGGAATAGILEELFSKGAERVLLFGSCGVLAPELTAGHLILPTAAYRDEGASYHYLPAGDYVDVPTAPQLAAVFDELKLPYVMGKTWTTDAIYRETRKNTDARRQDGCLTVEMECASVMAVGQFRKKSVYQFLYAMDSLAGEDWDPRTWGTPQSDDERYLRIALEAAVRLDVGGAQ